MKMQINVIFVKKNLKINNLKIYYTWAYKSDSHKTCNLKQSVPKEIPITFHSRSNDSYHFIIKELAEEFEKQVTCLC